MQKLDGCTSPRVRVEYDPGSERSGPHVSWPSVPEYRFGDTNASSSSAPKVHHVNDRGVSLKNEILTDERRRTVQDVLVTCIQLVLNSS